MLKYAPTNEQEVVFLFAYISEKLGYTVKRVQTEFPDCILIDKNNNELKVEFEFKSNHFNLHKHNISKCDAVITWEDDINLRDKIKVIELKDFFSNLLQNPDIKIEERGVSITEEGLCLIAKGEADKNNLTKLFSRYHLKEREKEPIRFVARLIINGGEPEVKDGKIFLRKPIDMQEFNYSVSKNKDVLNQAKTLLKKIGFDFG